MKKRLLVNAPDNQVCDLITRDFQIIKLLDVKYRNEFVLNDINFDAYLNIDSYEENLTSVNISKFCELNNIKTIGSKRYSKSTQHMILKKFGINTPETYFIYKTTAAGVNHEKISDFSLVELLLNISDDTQLILKIENGARGLGQVLISKKHFLNYALNGFSFKEPSKESSFSKKYEDSYLVDDRDRNYIPENANIKVNGASHIMPYLSSSCYIIQKYINIKAEYRYLYFYDEDPIIIERKKTENDWQANSCLTGHGTHIRDTILIPNFAYIQNKINELAEYLNVPFLSVDIYVDKNDNFGLFEFQMEFGIMFVPHKLLVDRMNKSIKNKLNFVDSK